MYRSEKVCFENKDDLREPAVKIAQQQQLDRKEGKERWVRRKGKEWSGKDKTVGDGDVLILELVSLCKPLLCLSQSQDQGPRPFGLGYFFFFSRTKYEDERVSRARPCRLQIASRNHIVAQSPARVRHRLINADVGSQTAVKITS